MAEETIDTIKAVLEASIGNLTAEMNRAANAIEAVATKSQSAFGRAGSEFSKFGAKTIELNQALELAAKGFELLRDTLGEAIAEAAAHEQEVAQLNATLQSTGRFTDGYSTALQRLAQQFESTTTFTEDQTLAVERLLVQYGAAPADIQPFTQAIEDAAAAGKDLNGVAEAVAAAFQGKFTQAARLLKINLDEGASSSVNLEKVLAALREQYGGRAAAELATFGGAVKSATNLFHSLEQTIGEGIIKAPAMVQALADIREALSSEEAKQFAETIGQNLGQALSDFIGIARGGIAVFDELKGALKGLSLGLVVVAGGLVGIPKLISAVNVAFATLAANPVAAILIATATAAGYAASKWEEWQAKAQKTAETEDRVRQLAEAMQQAADANIPFTDSMREAILAGTDSNVVFHRAKTGLDVATGATDALADSTRRLGNALSQQAQKALQDFSEQVGAIGVKAEAMGPLFDASGERLQLFGRGLDELVTKGVPAAQAIAEVEAKLGKFQDLFAADVASKLAIGLAQAGIAATTFGGNFNVAAASAEAVSTQLGRVTQEIALSQAAGDNSGADQLAASFFSLNRALNIASLDAVATQLDGLSTVNAALGKSFETSGAQAGVLETALTALEQKALGLQTALAGNITPTFAAGYRAELEKTLAEADQLKPRLIAALGTQVADGIGTELRGLNIDLALQQAELSATFETEAQRRIGIAGLEAEAEVQKAADGFRRRSDLMIAETEAAGGNADALRAARVTAEDQITAVAAQAKEKRIGIVTAGVEAEKKKLGEIGPAFAQAATDGISKLIFEGGKAKDFFSSLKDFGISELKTMFEKTIENKVGILDDGFRGNLLEDIPNMFSTMSKSVLGIFGKLWSSILGGKESGLDQPLSNLLGGQGGGGGGILNTVGGAQKLLGAISQTGILGNAGTGALGNLGTIGGFLSGGGSFATPATALTAEEAKLLFPRGGVPDNFTASGAGSLSSIGNGLTGLLGAAGLVTGLITLFSKNASTASRALGAGGAVLGASSLSGSLGGPTLTSVLTPYLTQLATSVGTQVGIQVGATAASSAAAASTFELSTGQIYALLPAIAGLVGAQLQKSGSPQIQATGRGLSTAATPIPTNPFSKANVTNPAPELQGLGESLLIGGPGGSAFASALGLDVFGHNISGGQGSRRALGSTLGDLSSIANLGDTKLNLDPYTTGLTSIAKAAAAYPQLFQQAGAAATAFGTVIADQVKSGQSDAKEFNFITETLIDNFGKAGVSGPDAIARVAGSFRELGIDANQAGTIIQQAFDQGKISQEQFQTSMAGLGQVAQQSTAQIVAALRKGLTGDGERIFQRLQDSGADAFGSVQAAGNDAFRQIASGLSNELLPNAVATFEALKSIGISSAEAIAAAFASLAGLGASFPEGTAGGVGGGPGTPQFFQHDNKLIFGQFSGGNFSALPAPATTGAEQVTIRKTAPKFDLGGVVPGPIGAPVIATVHAGETILPTHKSGGASALGDEIARAVAEAMARVQPQVMVVPVAFEDQLVQRLHRAHSEGRYVLPSSQQEKPVGIR